MKGAYVRCNMLWPSAINLQRVISIVSICNIDRNVYIHSDAVFYFVAFFLVFECLFILFFLRLIFLFIAMRQGAFYILLDYLCVIWCCLYFVYFFVFCSADAFK